MELLPPPDFFDSIDFNIFAAEFFHTQEHEFDATLTEGEHLKQIENVKENEEKKKEEEEEKKKKEEVPICDDKKVETQKQEQDDEPKVEN